MFDHFAKEKSDFLNKKDKSRKGFIDTGIAKLVDLINSKKDYCTTSSCAGRIVLLEIKSRKKNECSWIFSKHGKAKSNEIINALKKYNKNQSRELPLKESKLKETSFKSNTGHPIWLKQQPLILHVACRNLDVAKKLLDTSRKIFKHSGILSITEKKIIVEIIGNERIETIVAGKDFIADENYLKNLIRYANKNFEENKKKNERLFNILRSNI